MSTLLRVALCYDDFKDKGVTLSVEALALALQPFVKGGSTLGVISTDDLTIFFPADKSENPSVGDMVSVGTPLFDAMIYHALGDKSDVQVVISTKDASVPEAREWSLRVFVAYFFLLTQAHYPRSIDKAPKFIRESLAFSESMGDLAAKLASFDLSKMPTAWIRHILFEGFGTEAMSRLGLGVAGYRLLCGMS